MSLRNKLTILSITLLSFMTIPTLAENDTAPVTSRIENANFDVQIKTPEGWSPTNDFTSVPETFTHEGQLFRGLQFKDSSGLNGCVVYFAESSQDSDDDDKVDFLKTLAVAQELAFPGSTLSKVALDGSFAADFKTEVAKLNVKGTLEGNLANETGDPTTTTITGTLQSDTTKGNFIIGSGTLTAEGAMPLSGTSGVLLNDDYQVTIALWGTDEETQVKDAYRFLEAIAVTKKAPDEVAIEPTTDGGDVSEPVDETTSATVAVITSIVVVEIVQETPVATETLAIPETPVVAETFAITETPVATETLAIPETPVVAETFAITEAPVATETPAVTETPVLATEASA